LTINGYRTVHELNGNPAIEKVEPSARQIIMVSRSFQSPVYDLEKIKAALCEYTQEAVKRMREDKLSCRYVTVYLMTNAFAQGEQYFKHLTAKLPYLSAYLPGILAAATERLEKLYQQGYKYRKVMIGLTGLENDESYQIDLFDDHYSRKKELESLMMVFDKINGKYGRGTISLGTSCLKDQHLVDSSAQSFCDTKTSAKALDTAVSANLRFNEQKEKSKESWKMRRNFLSPCYTTNIEDIPRVF